MVTADQIWEAIQKDSDFQPMLSFPEVSKVLEDYVRHELLTAMGQLMDEPATPVNIIRGMVAFAQDYLRTDLTDRIANAGMALPVPAEHRQEVAGWLKLQMFELLREIVDLTKDDHWYKSIGLTDDDMYERMGMTPANRAAANQGQLTIGQLLTSQPHLLLVMSPDGGG